MSAFTIHLKDLKFHSAHGLHAEERSVGTQFLVDVDILTAEVQQLVTKIDDTVDYSRVYALVKARMEDPTPLLETCCMKIAEDIQNSFPAATGVRITITKLSPPISNFSGKVAVSYTRTFDP